MNFVFNSLSETMGNFATGILELFGDFVSNIFNVVAEVNFNQPMVKYAASFTTSFGIVLLTCIALKQYFMTFVMESGGDPDSDPLNLLLSTTQALAICCCNAWLFQTFMSFSKDFTNDLTNSAGDVNITVTITDLLTELMSVGTLKAGCTMILVAVMVVGLLVFSFIAGKRGAELSLMYIMLPLFASDLLSSNKERWNTFVSSYIFTFLYYALQLLCFRFFCTSLLQVNSGLSFMDPDVVASVGWFIMMLSSPKWLEKFCYSTGIKSGGSNGLRSVTFMVPSILLKR